jgi:phosphate starvation-inducible PhoH-like protein
LKKNSKRKTTKPIDLTNDITPQTHQYRNRLKPRSENQAAVISTIQKNTITFVHGPAGSGKTLLAVGMAIESLLDGKANRIIMTRPILEAGERMGFIPGTAEEKIHPYLLPILDEIRYFIPMSEYASLKDQKKIEIVPLGHMRGRNFHDCFIIADECQNASYEQLKMLLTRVGQNSKMVLTGDVKQSDLSRHLQGGFLDLINALDKIEGIGMSVLEHCDIVRNPIIAKILERLDIHESRT